MTKYFTLFLVVLIVAILMAAIVPARADLNVPANAATRLAALESFTNNVGEANLVDGAVTTNKLGADAVTGAKLADDACDSEHYTDGSIDTAHIADAQVTPAKANTALKTKVCVKDIEGFNADQQEYIFVAPYDCTIVSIGLVSDTATTASSATTNWAFQVANLTITSNLCSSAKSTSDTEVTGDTLYDLGADQFLTLSAGDVLELQATKTDTPTSWATAEIISVVEFY